MNFNQKTDPMGHSYLEVSLKGSLIINNPLLNKGMSFSEQERHDFALHGLLPAHIASLDEQCSRSFEAFSSKDSDIEKYIYLRDLQNSNEVLFYRLLTTHLTQMLPIVYTPVVGEGCQRFSKIYRRPRGIYLAYPNKNRIAEILANPDFDEVKVIVVSDGERILGLGDQGAGGMGIPIGKLALYSACAGVHPASTLPILLDTGTNNQESLDDPLYVGWKHERVRGKDYDDFIEAFVSAVKKRFPQVVLQWEDFAQQNANPILERYRDQLCTFNDDIQGTASIATGTLLAALTISGVSLKNHRIAILGGGSAGCGIANLIVHAMMHEGLSEKQALSQIYLVDRNGLLIEGATGLMTFQERFCHNKTLVSEWDCLDPEHITLMDVVKQIHPTVLIGVSGQPNMFTEDIVKEMADHVDRPVIFPLSNPTSRSEAVPEDLLRWTDNKAIIGTGSPFPPVMINGVSTRIDQTNNAYIFPGMGLGLIAVKATRVTDKMFMLAASALAARSPAINDPSANLLPPLSDIRSVSLSVALAVAKEAVESGLAPYQSDADIEKSVRDCVWEPVYLPYKYSESC